MKKNLVDVSQIYMGVSKNRGIPKWMVKIMENPIKMDDLGVPLFLETPILMEEMRLITVVDLHVKSSQKWKIHDDSSYM